jgi:hypothetical protein
MAPNSCQHFGLSILRKSLLILRRMDFPWSGSPLAAHVAVGLSANNAWSPLGPGTGGATPGRLCCGVRSARRPDVVARHLNCHAPSAEGPTSHKGNLRPASGGIGHELQSPQAMPSRPSPETRPAMPAGSGGFNAPLAAINEWQVCERRGTRVNLHPRRPRPLLRILQQRMERTEGRAARKKGAAGPRTDGRTSDNHDQRLGRLGDVAGFPQLRQAILHGARPIDFRWRAFMIVPVSPFPERCEHAGLHYRAGCLFAEQARSQ